VSPPSLPKQIRFCIYQTTQRYSSPYKEQHNRLEDAAMDADDAYYPCIGKKRNGFYARQGYVSRASSDDKARNQRVFDQDLQPSC